MSFVGLSGGTLCMVKLTEIKLPMGHNTAQSQASGEKEGYVTGTGRLLPALPTAAAAQSGGT